MPIYAYKCSSCGHEQDVLQKVSAARLTNCPQCQAESFTKQLTAAGFQLKGSGWYATDFKNGSGPKKAGSESKSGDAPSAPNAPDAGGSTKTEKKEAGGSSKTEKKESSTVAAGSACGQGGCAACS